MRRAIVICVERVCVGCVWCRRAVKIAGGRVGLGVSGVVVPWGLVGGVSCLVLLGFPLSCQAVSCRVMSCRVAFCCVAS